MANNEEGMPFWEKGVLGIVILALLFLVGQVVRYFVKKD